VKSGVEILRFNAKGEPGSRGQRGGGGNSREGPFISEGLNPTTLGKRGEEGERTTKIRGDMQGKREMGRHGKKQPQLKKGGQLLFGERSLKQNKRVR